MLDVQGKMSRQLFLDGIIPAELTVNGFCGGLGADMKKLLICAGLFIGVVLWLYGCDGPATAEGTAASSPFAPAPARKVEKGRVSVRGQAFVKLMVGADSMAGMKVQLVDADQFLPRWGEARERYRRRFQAFRARVVADDILALQKQIRDARNARMYREKLLSIKREELGQCQRERWVSFTYVDPVTDKSSSVEVNPQTYQMMHTRLAALEKLLPQYDKAILDLKQQIVARASDFRQIDPAFEGKTAEEILALTGGLLDRVETESDIPGRTTEEIVAALNAATLDETTVDRTGHFIFPNIAAGNYLVYASHETAGGRITWLREVEFRVGVPRELILSSQNSLDWERTLEINRADALEEAMRADVSADPESRNGI